MECGFWSNSIWIYRRGAGGADPVTGAGWGCAGRCACGGACTAAGAGAGPCGWAATPPSGIFTWAFCWRRRQRAEK